MRDMAPSAGCSAFILSPHKLLPPVPLRIKQCREIAVIDPRGGGCGDRGLGMVDDAEGGILDHIEIVGVPAASARPSSFSGPPGSIFPAADLDPVLFVVTIIK